MGERDVVLKPVCCEVVVGAGEKGCMGIGRKGVHL